MRFAAALTTLLMLQLITALAESPPTGSDAQQSSVLQFQQSEQDFVQAGYVTLSWNSVAGAVEYQVHGNADATLYRGPFTQAFLSGLDDGHYEFHAQALDDQGIVIASSQVPAVVTVKHWSLSMALALFACGLVVFLVIVAVIVRGTWIHQRTSTAGEAP